MPNKAELAANKGAPDLLGRGYDIVDFLALVFVWIFTVFSVLVFGALLFLAGREFYEAVCIGVHYHPVNAEERPDTESLIRALEGLELVFLSPLAYFLIRSLSAQMIAYFVHKSPTPEARAQLVEVKSLNVGLLTSVLAADLVGRAVKLKEGAELGYSPCIEMGVLVILCGYYFLLHNTATHIRKE